MSNVEEVYMKVPAVRDISKLFGGISEFLTDVSNVLELLSDTLKSVAFIGLVGGQVWILVLETIRPKIQKLAEQTAEISRDVDASATAFENSDQQGATRFY